MRLTDHGDRAMLRKRTMNVFVLIIVLMIGTVAVRLATGASVIPAIVAQSPIIGPTNTAAAKTAQAGVTAITASDAPPTPTVAPTPAPPPTFPPTPAVRASPAPTILPSSGSAIVPATPAAATPSSSTGQSSAWPVVITLAVIAIIAAAGIGGARIARGGSLRK